MNRLTLFGFVLLGSVGIALGFAQAQEGGGPPPDVIVGESSVSSSVVSALGGQSVSRDTITVRVPASEPLVEYVLTNQGATLRHARMLHPRYRRNESFRPVPGVPDERIGEGPIDVVSSWSTPYLPYRLQFNQLVVGASEEAQVKATLYIARATGGTIVGARVSPPDVVHRTINRAVRPGDTLTITAPETAKGSFRVVDVRDGVLGTEPALPIASAEGVDYEVTRTGDLKSLFEADPTYTRVSPLRSDGSATFPIVYVWPDPTHDDSPIYVEKRFSLGSHSYELKLDLSIYNVSDQTARIHSGLTVGGWQHQDQVAGSMFSFPTNLQGADCYTSDGLQHYDYTEFDDTEEYPNRQWPKAGEPDSDARGARWIGVATRYFLLAAVDESAKAEGQCLIRTTALPHGTISSTLYTGTARTLKSGAAGCVPDWLETRFPGRSCGAAYKVLGHTPGTPRSQILKTYQLRREELSGDALVALEGAWTSLKSRQRSVQHFTLFSGPKDSEMLKVSGHHLEASLDFGMFAFLSEPMLWLLRWFFGVFGHWAMAIIALTLLVKAVLLPLTQKSFVSMQKMQQLRPKIDALKEEYGDRKEDFAKAQMALFKREGVNPLGGCLPMLLQMPIWFALYRTIYSSVELFNAPLGGWIQDLSAPDPYYVMPIVLGIV
ncbi:MAG: YidC/Oxa1 family insertase periplasmic-domain containing protein, partial [Myxococcota bacterium]|nr:YidC/Oxa1 family insertase periplasmic-domain containing protein [Myxococcota bacterium]